MSSEADWSKAPEWVTHSLAAGPEWPHFPGIQVHDTWAFVDDRGNYTWPDADHEKHECFVIADDAWIIVEERPIRTEEEKQREADYNYLIGRGLASDLVNGILDAGFTRVVTRKRPHKGASSR